MNNPKPALDARGVTAPPFLDQLQEPMEAIALGERENQGRFCGECYAVLDHGPRHTSSSPQTSVCALCETPTDDAEPVESVPDAVLAIYLAKRRREGLIVNLFAFAGIFLSLVLSGLLWFLLPDNWWRLLPFAALAICSYYFARVIGYNVGVPLGSRSGRRLRDRRWQQFVRDRSDRIRDDSGAGIPPPPPR